MKRVTRSGAVFSSDDSIGTDHSINSSTELVVAPANEKTNSRKVNQLREHMNQLFLVNPELIDSIKFSKLDDEQANADPLAVLSKSNENNNREFLTPQPQTSNSPERHKVKGYLSSDESPSETEETRVPKKQLNSKFWDVISREMTRIPKNSKMPTIKRVNNVLNIYKMKVDKPEPNYDLNNPKSTPRALGSNHGIELRRASMNLKDKKLKSPDHHSKGKDDNGESGKLSGGEQEDENGVTYYSFKKRMHLRLKEKRQKMFEERQKNQILIDSNNETNTDGEEGTSKRFPNKSGFSDTLKVDLGSGLLPSRPTTANPINGRVSGVGSMLEGRHVIPRRKSQKGGSVNPMSVIERLTKDLPNMNKKETEEDLLQGKEFKSERAKELYIEKKQFGDTETFKREALKRIKNVKREFHDKVIANRASIMEPMKFNKDKKSKKYNIYMPDFENVAGVPEWEREVIFAPQEMIMRQAEGSRDQLETDGLTKLNRILEGNILMFWKYSKETAS